MQFPKLGRVRLTRRQYKTFQQAVFKRDGWCCRRCGLGRNLQLHHHPVKRSKCRIDESWNACTLCADCHQQVERHVVDVHGNNCNDVLRFGWRHSVDPSDIEPGETDRQPRRPY